MMIYSIISNIIALEPWKKRLLLICLDSVVIISAVLFAMATRVGKYNVVFQVESFYAATVALLCTMLVFGWQGFYNAITRHVTIEATITVAVAIIGSAIFLLLAIVLFGLQINKTVPLIYAPAACLGVVSYRLIFRVLSQHIVHQVKQNVAIYGCGEAGRQLLEALKWNKDYRVCQLIDDDRKLHGAVVSGLKIESFDVARKKLKSKKIKMVLLAMPNAHFDFSTRVSTLVAETGIAVKSIPDLTSLINGHSNISELRNIEVEDLLGRTPAQPDDELMNKTINGKVVLVTGAGGSIGSELCRQISMRAPSELILLDISEFSTYRLLEELANKEPNLKVTPIIGSVQDKSILNEVLKNFSIDTIYHAAAYKHVPLMEHNAMQCVFNNVFGTLNIAEQAIEAKIKNVILISTDKAVNPTNIMGASKRLAELVFQNFAKEQTTTILSIVRFGNVLGSSGSVVPLFRQQIAAGGPVTVTDKDVIRYFMTIPEAAQLVIEAGSIGTGGDIFVLDMGQPVRILDLAKQMITLSGKKPHLDDHSPKNANQIPIIFTGLRPGEKMFEELSYSNNLLKTSQARIMTAMDEGIAPAEMTKLLADLQNAINGTDYDKFFATVALACDQVPNPGNSADVFIKRVRNAV